MTDPDSTNPCTGCGTPWPLTERYYHRRAQRARGFQSRCRACRASDENRPLVLANMLAPEGHKVCCRCFEPKPAELEHFYRSGYKDTLRGHCKVCAEEERSEYLSDPEVRAKRAEGKRESDARYYRENRERASAAMRRFYLLNRANRIEASRERRERVKNTPEYRAQRRAEQHRRRALKESATGSFTATEVLQMYQDQGGLCAYCERELNGEFHAEHMVPLSRGGSNDWSNIAVACPLCNLTKHTRTAEEFMEQVRST